MCDYEPSKLVQHRGAVTGPLGGLRFAWGMTREVSGTLGFFYVALDHMRCDVGVGRRGGPVYLDCLIGGGLGSPSWGRRSGEAVCDG